MSINKTERILVLGSYGRGNTGDDAFLLAAIALFPGVRLYSNAANKELLPREARDIVETIATTNQSVHDISQKAQVFWSIQNIVYCGGDLWAELYGERFPRKSLYRMALLNIFARLTGKKVFYIGCGVGKLSGYSLWLARLSARMADGILVRDKRSAVLLHLPQVEIAPDLAINLPYYQPKRTAKKRRAIRVGISVLYFVPNPKRNFPHLVNGIASFINALPADAEIFLLPMLVSREIDHDDLWASEQVRAQVPDRGVRIVAAQDVMRCIKIMHDLDFVVAARLHANILATLSGTPCLGISYRPKVASFFRENGLEEYCIDITELDQLEPTFVRMLSQETKVRCKFRAVSKQNLEERSVYQAFIDRHF